MSATRRPVFVALLAAASVVIIAAANRAEEQAPRLALTHGVASGDVTTTSAVLWSRASGASRLHVEAASDPDFRRDVVDGSTEVSDATDFTGQVTLRGLEPDTRYWYRAQAVGRARAEDSDTIVGNFKTAPTPGQSRIVSFIVGADVGGQQFCRNVAQGGYAIFARMEALAPDFYISNGDAIYADGDCPADGPDGPGGWQNIPGDFPNVGDVSVNWTNTAQVRDVFERHYRYNRADPFLQSFLRSTSMIAQWDDHEVINDFGAPWSYWNSANITRPGYPNLVAEGLRAFFAYSPIDRRGDEPNRIYRSLRWGRDAEVFVLDARSYRDRNDLPDTAANDKQMLGRQQIDWLIDGLRRSSAAWKIVSSDVPISITTGSVQFGRDAWANLDAEPSGFERELLRLLARLDEADVENVVFVTTDVHFAQTIIYNFDANGDGDRLLLRELVSGPLNAVLSAPRPLDPAANPTAVYGEGGIFNFSHVRIEAEADGQVRLLATVRGPDGAVRPGSTLNIVAR
jgi:alkaline phosphatase D